MARRQERQYVQAVGAEYRRSCPRAAHSEEYSRPDLVCFMRVSRIRYKATRRNVF